MPSNNATTEPTIATRAFNVGTCLRALAAHLSADAFKALDALGEAIHHPAPGADLVATITRTAVANQWEQLRSTAVLDPEDLLRWAVRWEAFAAEQHPNTATGYPNPKVNALLSHVGDFTPRDFLDAALAMLDQASLRTAAYNRAYAAVEAVIAAETPKDDDHNNPAWDVPRPLPG